jgi:hypothetical protein
MRFVVVPIYDDAELFDVLDQLDTDVHVLSDIDDLAGLVETCLPSTQSVDEMLALAVYQEIARATAEACATRAVDRWG